MTGERRRSWRPLIAALIAAGTMACDGGRPVVVDAEPPPDAMLQPDLPRPDAALPCPVCPTPQQGTVCLSGRAYRLPALAAWWSGLTSEPKPLTSADGVGVKVHDPIAIVTSPASKPLGSAAVDANGCFIVKQLAIPFAGFFAVVVDDAALGIDAWAPLVTYVQPSPDKNLTGLQLAAASPTVPQQWSALFGFYPLSKGALILAYRDKASGSPVAGVTPTQEGKPWNFSGAIFDADLRTMPHFVKGGGATTSSGMVLVHKAQIKSYSGTKAGCTIGAALGGSAPGMLFMRVIDVSGC